MLLNKASMSLKHLTSTDTSRWSMTGVVVEKDYCIATDSKIIGLVTHPKEDVNDFPVETESQVDVYPEKRLSLDVRQIEKIKKLLPKKPRIPVLESAKLTMQGCKVKLTSYDGDDFNSVTSKPVVGTFVPYEKVLNTRDGLTKVAINLNVLSDLVKTAKEFYATAGVLGDNPVVTLGLDSDNSLKSMVSFYAEGSNGQELKGGFMPVDTRQESLDRVGDFSLIKDNSENNSENKEVSNEMTKEVV